MIGGIDFAPLGGKLLEIILTPLITALVAAVLALVVQKLRVAGVDLNQKQQDALEGLLREAALVVEEQARRRINMKGPEKATAAVAIVKAKRPDLDFEVIRQKLDAVLPELRKQLEAVSPPAYR